MVATRYRALLLACALSVGCASAAPPQEKKSGVVVPPPKEEANRFLQEMLGNVDAVIEECPDNAPDLITECTRQGGACGLICARQGRAFDDFREIWDGYQKLRDMTATASGGTADPPARPISAWQSGERSASRNYIVGKSQDLVRVTFLTESRRLIILALSDKK